MKEYKELETIFKKINDINDASLILYWDSSVIMPSGSGSARAEQLATLNELSNEILNSNQVKELLLAAENDQHLLNEWQQANLQQMLRLRKHATAVDIELSKEMARASSHSEQIWRVAKETNDFKLFLPELQKIIKLKQQVAKMKAAAFNSTPYDALLDSYDPGRKSAEIDQIFACLLEFLPNFTKEIVEKQKSQPVIKFDTNFTIKKQKQFSRQAMAILGFDFNRGRVDSSTHPFCGGTSTDIRITNSYHSDNLIHAFVCIVHETGHGLYVQNLPEEWVNQPVGQVQGMSIHESQAIIIEMQLCKAREFIEFIHPQIIQHFGSSDSLSVENLYKLLNRVTPSLIRVDADEVTFPLHVIMRYKLEKALIDGELEAADLPDAWNEQMQSLFGIKPSNYSEGCLQDIHWAMGHFGYFPTYALGSIIAVQLFAKAKEQLPNLMEEVRQGNCGLLTNWLKEHIHQYGSKLSPNQLLLNATGKNLDTECYKNYLRSKFL